MKFHRNKISSSFYGKIAIQAPPNKILQSNEIIQVFAKDLGHHMETRFEVLIIGIQFQSVW
jgi:hypothetical protein